MTVWSANNVARFARGAGFAGDDQAAAVAIALAASGGDDAWHYTAGLGAAVDERGLWGIDTARVPWVDGLDLYDPATNAAAAAAVFRAVGGSWAWHPVFGAPGYLAALETAQRAVSEGYRPDVVPELGHAAAALAAGAGSRRTIATLGRTLSEVGRAIRSHPR